MPTTTRPNRETAEKLNQIAFGYMGASALSAITRLEIADVLADATMSIEELAKKTSTNKDALCRVLRLLCSLGVFAEVESDRFANNETSRMLQKDAESSLKDMVTFITDPFHFKAYTDMVPTIRDGKSAVEHVWGKPCFEVLADDKEEQILFNNAMTNFSNQAIAEILDAYDFSDIGTLVDVAGGHGALLTGVLKKYPKLRGIVFELEHVAPGARENIAKQNLSDRCDVASGDFFKAVPTGDAIMMKHIIHDWNDELAVSILKNCREALAKTENGKVLLAEMLLCESSEPHPSKFLDIEMLMLPGGKERTEKQFADLFLQAGLKLNRVLRTKSPMVILEAVLN